MSYEIMHYENRTTTNKVYLTGRLGGLELSHRKFGINFYRGYCIVKRESGIEDNIPIIFSEELLGQFYSLYRLDGRWAEIEGMIRTYNEFDVTRHLRIYVYIRKIRFNVKEKEYLNVIFITGHLCKEPVLKNKSYGIDITDFMIVINRFRKKYYVPCIAYEEYAHEIAKLGIGTEVRVFGEIHSRKYIKKNEENTVNKLEPRIRVAYEVLCRGIKIVERSL